MSDNDISTRLYIMISATDFDQFEETRSRLEGLAQQLDIACVSLPIDESETEKSTSRLTPPNDQQLSTLINTLQHNNIAVLAQLTRPDYGLARKAFEKSLEKTSILGFDGVHMNADETLYERAREVLDPHATIGVECGLSKHQAMVLGELGADYVAFSASQRSKEHAENLDEPLGQTELIDWWQQLFEVPCVAANIDDQWQLSALLQARAEFIALTLPLLRNEIIISWLVKKCPAAARKGES